MGGGKRLKEAEREGLKEERARGIKRGREGAEERKEGDREGGEMKEGRKGIN